MLVDGNFELISTAFLITIGQMRLVTNMIAPVINQSLIVAKQNTQTAMTFNDERSGPHRKLFRRSRN